MKPRSINIFLLDGDPTPSGLPRSLCRQFKPLLTVSLPLPPTFIQLERDSGVQFCPDGRVVQRMLARSWS